MDTTLHHAPTRESLPISIGGRGDAMTHELQNYARQRLSVALCRFVERIRQVEVWVEDINGPRGGVDKRCRVELRLTPRGQVTVSADATNEFAAVAHAARRAAAALDRKSKRTWTTRRRQATRSSAK